VRLPAIVIGGGLTGVDTATEIFAYYPVQVEKMLGKFETIAEDRGEAAAWAAFDDEEKKVFGEFLVHGKAIREERRRAAEAGEEPNFVPLIQSWGGVSLVYRKGCRIRPLIV
jgi:NADPH-dependent glutamate synthase beta subunit-like oxidoreductase